MLQIFVLLHLWTFAANAAEGFEVLLPPARMTAHERRLQARESVGLSSCRKLLAQAAPATLSRLFDSEKFGPLLAKAKNNSAVRNVLADAIQKEGSSYGEFLRFMASARTMKERSKSLEMEIRAHSILLRDQKIWFSDWDAPEILAVRFDENGMPQGLRLAYSEEAPPSTLIKNLPEIFKKWGMQEIAIHFTQGYAPSNVRATREFFSNLARLMKSTEIRSLEITVNPQGQQNIQTFLATLELLKEISLSEFARSHLKEFKWYLRPQQDWREQPLEQLSEAPEYFRRFKNLESLALGGEAAEPRLLTAVVQAQAPLRRLALSNSNWVGEDFDFDRFDKLQSLSLVNMNFPRSQLEKFLGIVPQLREVDVRFFGDTEDVRYFQKSILTRALRVENLRMGISASPLGKFDIQKEIDLMAALPSLRRLDLFDWSSGYTTMNQINFNSLERHPRLEKINLRGAATRRQLESLVKIPTLQSISPSLFKSRFKFPENIKHIDDSTSGDAVFEAPGLISFQHETWLKTPEIQKLHAHYPNAIIGSGVSWPFDPETPPSQW